ncbi:MAG: SpoVG family protein [Aquificaceae bacterium]|nr:SpoVG family protein [Aquificaceae bacterium]
MKVELLTFYPFEVSTKRPRLLGYADVKIEDYIVIRGIKLFESRHGGYFISMPEFNAETKRAMVEVEDKELLEKLRRVVVDYYKEYVL